MTRRQRSVHDPAFEPDHDFDAQLYAALRQAPWWMISLAVHVLVFVVSGLISGPTTLDRRTTIAEIRVDGAADQPVEPEKKPDEEIEKVRPEDLQDPVPQPLDQVEVAGKPETDNDLPFDEVYGNTDGTMSGDLEGVSNNRLVGVGGAVEN